MRIERKWMRGRLPQV